MARLIGPSEASREVKTIVSTAGSINGLFRSKAGRPATFYLDAAATQLADILLDEDGSPLAGSTVEIDDYSMLPLIRFPDGVDKLFVVVDEGPAWPVYAREDDRLDALASDVSAKVPLTRTITAGTGLSGGGDLSANRALTVAYGTAAGTAAQGNDARIAPVFTPEQFGATGSLTAAGAVNETTYVQQAIDAASAVKGVVLLSKYYGLALSGTAPSKRSLTLKPNVTIRGVGMGRCGLRLLTGQGSYFALMMATTLGTDLGVQHFEEFDLDLNTAGNAVPSLADLLTNPRRVIHIATADSVSAHRVRVTGHTGINTFQWSGVSLGHTSVTRCQFLDIGVMPAGEGTDHSTLYLEGNGDSFVRGNTFEGTSPLGAHAAIETHQGRCVVTGNQVTGYGIFANITGVQVGPGDNVVVTGNTGTDIAIGVALYSMDVLGGAAPGLRNVTIADNQFTLDRDYHLPFADDTFIRTVQAIMLFPESNLHVENLDIHHNQVHVKPYSLAANIDEGIAAGVVLWRTVTPDGPDINVRVSDNTFVNLPGPGVRISGDTRGLRVRGNTIIDPGGTNHGSTPAPFKVGVFMAGTQTDCEVADNLIVDTRATHKITDGVYAAVITAVTNGRVLRNTVRCADGTSLAGFSPASGAGKAFYLDHEMDTWLGLFQPVKPGSRVRVRSTGAVYVNVNATDGGAPSFVQTIAGKLTLQASMITAASTPGPVVKKLPVYSADGITIEGWVPIYSAIT